MPSNRKKSKSKRTKTKRAAAKRSKKASRAKQVRPPKKALNKKQSKKKTASSRTSPARKRKTRASGAQPLESSWDREGAVSGEQTGDLQGLSQAEQADSESVDELVEEGNIFEAGAVAGVQEADNADEREVHTHEVPEDDVPEEYLDKE